MRRRVSRPREQVSPPRPARRPLPVMEFVTSLPLQVKPCQLEHPSVSPKWLWHPVGHVSLKLIFFFLLPPPRPPRPPLCFSSP